MTFRVIETSIRDCRRRCGWWNNVGGGEYRILSKEMIVLVLVSTAPPSRPQYLDSGPMTALLRGIGSGSRTVSVFEMGRDPVS